MPALAHFESVFGGSRQAAHHFALVVAEFAPAAQTPGAAPWALILSCHLVITGALARP